MGAELKAEELVDGQVPPFVELRVHGVGGTSPELMLDSPHTVLVRGDGMSGFYRRPGGSAVEAYSWGGLTSRSPRRALWVVLSPFAFLNVAGWMLPPGRGRWNRIEEALVRWAALYSTVMVVLLVGQPAIETIAVKCAGDPACVSASPLLSWMGPYQDTPARLLVIGAIFPLLFLVVLRGLARRSHHRYERISDPRPTHAGAASSLGDPGFWVQGPAFLQMTRLHFEAGCAAIGLVVAGMIWQMEALSPLSVLGVDLMGLLALANLAWLVLVGLWVAASGPTDTRVGRLHHLEDWPRQRPRRIRLPHNSMMITGFLLAAVAALAWFEPRTLGSGSMLDWYATTNVYAAVVGAVVPVFVLYLLLSFHPQRRRCLPSPLADADSSQRPDPDGTEIRAGFSGYGAGIAGLFGFMLAMTFLGALNGGIANWLGMDPFDRLDDFGALALIVLVLVIVMLGLHWSSAGRTAPEPADLHRFWPSDDGPDPGELDDGRRDWLAGITSRIRLRTVIARVDRSLSWLLVLVTAVLVVEVAGEAWSSSTGRGFSIIGFVPFWSWFEPAGWWLLVVGIPAVSFWGVRKVYSDVESRKAVGIVWDIATFFPRCYHPFAPPSYAGRAVPELQERLRTLTSSGSQVILSAHSQGSVIALATVAGLVESETLDHVALLTHGSPIGRLYYHFFPRHFAEPIKEVADALIGEGAGRWYNLYRPTDPIGGAIGGEQDDPAWPRPLVPGLPDELSPVKDPASLPPHPRGALRFRGDPHPRPRAHSTYYVEPSYALACERLRAALRDDPETEAGLP